MEKKKKEICTKFKMTSLVYSRFLFTTQFLMMMDHVSYEETASVWGNSEM